MNDNQLQEVNSLSDNEVDVPEISDPEQPQINLNKVDRKILVREIEQQRSQIDKMQKKLDVQKM